MMDDEQLRAYGEATSKIAADLMVADPSLHYVTATIIAGDLYSAQRATAEVNAGVSAEEVMWTVGSYARWDWVLQMLGQGALTDEVFLANIARLWSGSDPDDTKAENLKVWQRAHHANGGLIRDGRPLPKDRGDGLLRVFRGGSRLASTTGIAWTTNPKIARKFADGADQRMPRTDGVVVTGMVDVRNVLAFITGRSEDEVILDPRHVQNIHPTGAA